MPNHTKSCQIYPFLSTPKAMVLFKVGVSCYAAVLSDAKLKGFSNMSMSAKLSLMSLARVIASIAIAAVMEPGVQPSYHMSAAGFFDHWTMATWIVTLSFTSKSLITLYLLKSLDGIQKNVGEASAETSKKPRKMVFKKNICHEPFFPAVYGMQSFIYLKKISFHPSPYKR